MSNSQVGLIYQQIISDVIETSRVDLEENGVDESILEELKQGWQKKLSQQQLATFPWDPKPDPPVAATAPAPPPPQPISAPAPNDAANINGSGMPHQRAAHPNGQSYSTTSNPPIGDGRIKNEPGVKIEPGLENTTQIPHISNPANPGLASRVVSNLQQQYGDRASATINKLQEHMTPGANGPQYPGQQRPAGQSMQQQPHSQYQASNAQQQQQQQQLYHQQQLAHAHQVSQARQQAHPQAQHANQGQQHMPPHAQAMRNGQKPATSQFDGAGDGGYSGVIMHQDAAGGTTELGRVEIDRMLHAQIQARAQSMEGGGSMLPLKRTAKRTSALHHRAQAQSGPARFDGGDDDDVKSEQDDEAINSDLDDTDDNLDEDDDDVEGGQIMLCMYDKVQRVKNKWKCVLKDGVLSVNGKDYVFHKASGEYEW
ncbi:transcription factor IIA [Xylariales sp. AK1849]|nr:transcription factor IIA [Xylariales sp. AK1849]